MMDFTGLKLRVASPEDILRWSHGEVTKPETINYRTQRPEKDGLFSERIFGPTKDWECYCGKYRRVRYKNVVCDKCGVEVTRSVVRRERMGHIALATPVVHIWFFRNVPSKLGLMLDVPMQKLEKVIYYAAYIIARVDDEAKAKALEELEKEYKARKKTKEDGVSDATLKSGLLAAKAELQSLRVGEILGEAEYVNLAKRFGNVFSAGSGAEAIRKILEAMDMKKEIAAIKRMLKGAEDTAAEVRLLKRLKLLSGLHEEGMRPEWVIMTMLPVLPPDLRPMVALDGGRYATSDLNDLYRRVINRNNRLKKLMELKAPDVIVTNEKRMLQESVDALIDNSARFGAQQMSAQRRPLRSLADMLKGKQGRFRQNLLGKRVDYSGRSVIVIGPELQLHQCGLPKKMALEMFKPFVINKIIERGLAHNIRNANRLIEAAPPEVWEILEEVTTNKKVLLNRAPTLHRLGVQAFQPLLIEDLVIRIPPMVCTAFNADFDGDQMAVHLPLTDEAQREAREIMLSSVNLLKPATGDPIMVPTQDIVLGTYHLTRAPLDAATRAKPFSSVDEAMLAYDGGLIGTHTLIRVPHPKRDGEKIETTVGRLTFNTAMPKDFDFVNRQLDKKELSKVVGAIINIYGTERSAEYLDAIKKVGFAAATDSGISWGMDDMMIPAEKKVLLKEAEDAEAKIREQYNSGLLTESERRNRVISVWDKVKAKLAKILPQILGATNPIFAIISSGARGSWSQPTQMMGMKGLVANPKGETMELPVKASLKEGFSVLEYFISTHGARKGTTDTALKTASAGYLTRRLVDVSQDLVIREADCKAKEGIVMKRSDGAEFGHSFASRLFSRTALADVKAGNKALVRAGDIIDRKTAEAIEAAATVDSVRVRSPITCKTLYGLCSACYGFNLGNNQPVRDGEAVGIIAAQSIGEPGTQLTMRTFHIGGVAGADITHGLPRVEELFEARPPKGKAFMSEIDGTVHSIEEKGLIRTVRIVGSDKKDGVAEYPIPRTAEIFLKVGAAVKKGDQLSEGHLDIKELFALRGKEAVQQYIVTEVQRIYVSEGASINNKHIEIIVRQMFARVKIKDAGDTEFVPGDVVEKSRFLEVNRHMKRAGREPARAKQRLMSVTNVTLSTESFLS
ncbi:MAG: DNA-directed RNA polymerase subunit beta', partial [Candidatus Harrisonbacteria bacterium]|nr:DNA-directed RNA polymerase subunit beta' [Candidatus Harrisonbacteria bacterium]